jgi:hypothetical protein
VKRWLLTSKEGGRNWERGRDYKVKGRLARRRGAILVQVEVVSSAAVNEDGNKLR